jgi:hypothetical protein
LGILTGCAGRDEAESADIQPGGPNGCSGSPLGPCPAPAVPGRVQGLAASSSSRVRGQSSSSRRDRARSAYSLPPVWQPLEIVQRRRHRAQQKGIQQFDAEQAPALDRRCQRFQVEGHVGEFGQVYRPFIFFGAR